MRRGLIALLWVIAAGPLGGQVVELDLRSVADFAMPTAPPNRAALADAIVIGRVVALEDKDVDAAPVMGDGKVTYRIAQVAVTNRLAGPKDAKLVRVAFVLKKDVGPAVIRPRPWVGSPQLETGLDGLFFLLKHPTEKFYVMPMHFDFVPRSAPTFEKEAAESREAGMLLDRPLEGLSAKDAAERFRTAALLIMRYRSVRFSSFSKLEPVGEEESKLILRALREADWKQPQVFGRPHPWTSFLQLGLNAKDGWTPPVGGAGLPALHQAAGEWLERNGSTYRVQRVAEPR